MSSADFVAGEIKSHVEIHVVKKNRRPSSAIQKLLYDRKSAAYALSVSIRTVDYLIATKKLAFLKLGRKVMIRASEMERFAACNHFEGVAAIQ